MIYADFNGICTFADDDENGYLDLCGYGTISSLSHHKIRLQNGMPLRFFEPGDIQVDAIVWFFPEHTDIHNPHGKWFARFPQNAVVDNHQKRVSWPEHVCFKCRVSLTDFLDQVGRKYREVCPNCATPVMYPLLPPEDLAH